MQKISIPESVKDLFSLRLKFKNNKAKDLLDYLIESFRSDYALKELHEDRCGWRTISQASNSIGTPPSTAYGKIEGGMGAVFLELKENGLIETRYFPGERGRGGVVTKVRISSQKNHIKRLLYL